jgi:hypothetical protein
LHSLGDLWLDEDDLAAAAHHYREALGLAVQQGDMRHCAYCLAGLACVAARSQDPTSAGRLWTLAERVEHELGFRILAPERRRYERTLTHSIRESPGYREGSASAAHLDPLEAATEIFRS